MPVENEMENKSDLPTKAPQDKTLKTTFCAQRFKSSSHKSTCKYCYLLLFDVVLDDEVSDFLTAVDVSFTANKKQKIELCVGDRTTKFWKGGCTC